MTPLAVILLLATAVSAIRGPGGATLAANSHFRRGRLSRRYVQCEVQTTTTASATTAYTTSTPDTTPTKSLLSLSGPCGDANADANNPNGQSWWLNCGLDNSGWNPPKITLDELVYVDLSSLDLGNSIYAPCRDYVGYFNTYGAMHNLPPIMIAAIAMQESTCNPYAVGGGSEQGMMQLTGSNCDGAPGGNCQDINFNIGRGAEYLRSRIDANDGSVLLGLGTYNGWYASMTTADVYNQGATYGCKSMQNLDYMTQLLNGWLQGKNGYELGSYFNRKEC